MHIILGLIGLATAAYFLVIRARRGAEMTSELLEVADDIRAAARRFGFRRRTNTHPVDSIEDPRLAAGGVATAFLQLDDLPTADARRTLDLSLRKHFDLTAEEAEEIAVLGDWFTRECGTPDAAFERLARKLRGLDGANSFQPLMLVLNDVAQTGAGELSTRQREALESLSRVFNLR